MRSTAMILSCVLFLGADVSCANRWLCECLRTGGELEQKWHDARRQAREAWIRIEALAAGEEVVL